MNEMTEALCRELILQNTYLQGDRINTIYFGGGTPSLLSSGQICKILETIRKVYLVTEGAEVTLEANPDDLGKEKLQILYDAGINRLSIGIQSFNEEVLKFLNRAHDQQQAIQCIETARTVGFNNLSIDLIYAIPSENHDNWHLDLARALEYRPEHISSYCLTIEPRTVFGNWLKRGRLPAVEEEFAAEQFEILVETLSEARYDQYEVSNFGLPGFYSRHNSSYWKQEKYLGIGPSAHSYDGITRQFNVSKNHLYMQAIAEDTVPAETDVLTREDRINEYLLTTLRTKWGANLHRLRDMGYSLEGQNKEYLEQLLLKKYAIIEAGHLKLTRQGMLLADKISSDLFVI